MDRFLPQDCKKSYSTLAYYELNFWFESTRKQFYSSTATNYSEFKKIQADVI